MEHKFNLSQKLIQIDPGVYDVEITINGEETLTYEYDNTNQIQPLYNSLIQTIDDMDIKDAHIELKTGYKKFAQEVMGSPNKNTSMLNILIDLKERKNITIEAK